MKIELTMANIKDNASTIGAALVAMIGGYEQYLNTIVGGAPFNYKQAAFYIILALGLFLQGKNADGSTKSSAQLKMSQKDTTPPAPKV